MSHRADIEEKGRRPARTALVRAKRGLISEWYNAVEDGLPGALWVSTLIVSGATSGSRVAAAGPSRVRDAAIGAEFCLGLLDATGGRAVARALGPARSDRATSSRTAQRRRPDPIEVQPGAALHQPPVVPQQLPQVASVALQVDGQRRPLDDDLCLCDSGPENLEMGP